MARSVITEDITALFPDGLSWSDRQKIIEQTFPSTVQLAWEKAFRNDTALFGEVVRGILKYDQARQGRPGPRPYAKREDSEDRLRQFMGDDYSLDPMPQTLERLKGKLSIRALVAKTGLDYNVIFRLLHGKIQPDVNVMTALAEAFDKHPSYFLEYRIHVVVAALTGKMKETPEASITVYRKLLNGEY